MTQINLRKPTEDDLQRFKECLSKDEYHCQQSPEQWLNGGGEFWTFYDEKGNRVFCRVERVLRVHIQHDPEVPRRELAPLIYKGFYWLQGTAREKGYMEILFESRAPRLIQFLQKLFGFEPVKENYHLCVDRAASKSN